MSEVIAPNRVSHAMEDRLQVLYVPYNTYKVARDWSQAELAHQPGEVIDYVRFSGACDAHRPAVFYVPGFTEGIVAKAPFGLELAEPNQGFDVILPDQNRKGILRNPKTGRKDATYTQALNYLSIIEAEGLTDETMNFISHSYGSLVLNEMKRLATERGWKTFEGSDVVLLASAGVYKGERMASLGMRFLESLSSEGKKTHKNFPDTSGEMFKAGVNSFFANPLRAFRETIDLARRQIEPEEFMKGLGRAAIISYGSDKLYPSELYARAIESDTDGWSSRVHVNPIIKSLIEDYGATWLTPISLDDRYRDTKTGRVLLPQDLDVADELDEPDRFKRVIRGGREATHNDEQFNPARVANAVAEWLGTKPERN